MSGHDERRVVVVAGASSGIGKAAAKALATTGWQVIGIGRDPKRMATRRLSPATTSLRFFSPDTSRLA